MSDTVLGTGDIEINKIGKSLFHHQSISQWKEKGSKQHTYVFFLTKIESHCTVYSATDSFPKDCIVNITPSSYM